MKITQVLFIVLLLAACVPGEQEVRFPEDENYKKAKENILEQVDDSGRIVWQKPEEVVKLLGDISNKTIADIGAGSGYFTFRFALKAKKVIAIDIDPIMIKIIETFKQQLPANIQEKIETRLAIPSDPMLEKGEADVIAIINTIGYIENRSKYYRVLKEDLSTNGELFILDFKTKKLSINAPGMNYRVPLGELEEELEAAGFQVFESDDQTLDYQYIVRARKI
ncbi:class I SAM-dependent methyltransferase [Portibacter marinus]|uniref:class I SAM-dependent methyltransferase n=1 Tax=Portibacter marinus TaxID=2898660 RepID=UPI001F1DC67F|nr:methyltransferase domain-containing protein [Portibacter marinus]